MISSVRKYLKQCPLLDKDTININYLEGAKVKYTLENVPCNPIVRRYSDGGTKRQFIFIFASRENYDSDVLENMNIAKFFEDMSDWIEQQNDKKNFPQFPEGNTPTAIEVVTGGYLMSSDQKTARFQMQIKITYIRERKF